MGTVEEIEPKTQKGDNSILVAAKQVISRLPYVLTHSITSSYPQDMGRTVSD
jgi:hypothetical protein